MKGLLVIILILALFLRVYNVSHLVGFYYDQGRDALAVWNLWHHGDFFLIGPTTGIEGIFLGPFYYYLIAPAYLLGNGNPVFPAVELAVINVLGIYVVYKIGTTYFFPAAGLLAAALISVSYQLVIAHRWLSNPTPLPLFSALALWFILKIIYKTADVRNWAFLGLVLGLSLQLEAASAVFFLPAAFLTIFIFKRTSFITLKSVLFFTLTFFATLIPQILFNLRNHNLLINAFAKFLFTEKSFQPVLTDFLVHRLTFFFNGFMSKLVFDFRLAAIFLIILFTLGIFSYKKIPSKPVITLLIWCLTPVVFLLFYHGNHGFVWDYYLTGVYSVFILLIAVILTYAWVLLRLSRGILILGLAVFLFQNISALNTYFHPRTDSPEYIALGPSLAVVDWVYLDSGSQAFNVDTYVPPVIPYAYDYLFLWRGATKYHRFPDSSSQSLLYTVYETDQPHPERLSAWLARQAGIGRIESDFHLGGVTGQRRTRINRL